MTGEPNSASDSSSPSATKTGGADAFRYIHSANFPELLASLRASLFVTTYQAGKLLVFRAIGGCLSLLLRTFDQAMGLAVDKQRLAIGTRYQIWMLRNAPDIAFQLEPHGQNDACFIPRACHVTGDIRVHDLAFAGDELWIVNTRFSCLCTFHPDYSFVPRWRPTFITDLVAEDRCHLNGLAVADEGPRFVTALGETDSLQGWRANKSTGGCLLDVLSGETVLRGLCMPHSPRLREGRVWLLDSGTGRILVADPRIGHTEDVVMLPGYARGLGLLGNYAFVGLSRIRETATFGGLPVTERFGELNCGVWVIDVRTGAVAGFVKFESGVEEIYDVKVVAEMRNPAVVGLQKESIQNMFVVPAGTDRSIGIAKSRSGVFG